ncbi:MAG: hypothetical protein GC137_03500 [Alphaproteobacteria bacterium]|nr:hypothetical protein [Alphaproteobacteria bacterium]
MVANNTTSGSSKSYRITDPDALRREVKRRIGSDEMLSVVARDTTYSEDLSDLIKSVPRNFWKFLRRPIDMDINPLARMGTKFAVDKFDQAIEVVRTLVVDKPALTDANGMLDNLKKFDFNTGKYMEPRLKELNNVVLTQLEPLLDRHDGSSAAAKALVVMEQFKAFKDAANNSKMGPEAEGRAYQDVMTGLSTWLDEQHGDISKYVDSINEVIKKIDDLQVPTLAKDQYDRYRVHLDFLRQKVMVARDQAVGLYNYMKVAYEELAVLETEGPNKKVKSSIGEYVEDVFKRTNKDVKTKIIKAEQICDEAYVEVARKRRERDPATGRILNDDAAVWAGHYRIQKLGVDMGFIPESPRLMPIIPVITKPDNSENFVLKTMGFFDEVLVNAEGRVKTPDERNVGYANKIAEHIAQGYKHGYVEDMISAVQYLKYHEGRDSYDIFPDGFADLVKQQMVIQYMNEKSCKHLTKEEIENDGHIKEFLERIHVIVNEREHSPVVGGPRDTLKAWVKGITPFVGARYYPMPNSNLSKKGQFFATPFVHDFVEKPMIMARSKLWAYFTGGRLVDLSELGRGPTEDNNLEIKLGKAFKWDMGTVPLKEGEKSGFLGARFNRLPSWVKAPVRLALSPIGIGVAAIAGAPLLAVGAAAAFTTLNYGSKALRAGWSTPVIGPIVKKATTYATYLGLGGATLAGGAALALGAAPFALVGVPGIALVGGLGAIGIGGAAATSVIVNKFRQKPQNPIDSLKAKDKTTFGKFAEGHPQNAKSSKYVLEKPQGLDRNKTWEIKVEPVVEKPKTEEARLLAQLLERIEHVVSQKPDSKDRVRVEMEGGELTGEFARQQAADTVAAVLKTQADVDDFVSKLQRSFKDASNRDADAEDHDVTNDAEREQRKNTKRRREQGGPEGDEPEPDGMG